MPVNEAAHRSAPSIPISGKSLAVFGSFFGAGSAAADSTAGAAGVGNMATRIGTSDFGAGGGGGAIPVLFISCATSVADSSTTF